jgi:hypothetical protein
MSVADRKGTSLRDQRVPASRLRRDVVDRGTDQRNGVSFDQQDVSAVVGITGCNVIGAHAHVARHVAKSAESNRTRNMAWQSLERTGRPGVRARCVSRGGQGHRQFLAADRRGPQTG